MKSAGQLLLGEFFVFKRIMVLRERHRPGVVPAVDDFRHTRHIAPRTRGHVSVDAIDHRLVQLDLVGTIGSTSTLSFVDGSRWHGRWPQASQIHIGNGVPQ
jgi:hypothetical protein